jgi:hypothetical protein
MADRLLKHDGKFFYEYSDRWPGKIIKRPVEKVRKKLLHMQPLIKDRVLRAPTKKRLRKWELQNAKSKKQK